MTESGSLEGIPTAVQAVVLGLLVQAVGVLPFTFLASANLNHGASVPWAAAVELVLLFLLYRYLRGWGWPISTTILRRKLSRANHLEAHLRWPATVVTGLLGVSISLLIVLSYMVVRFPSAAGEAFLAMAAAPPVTAVALLMTLAVLTGIVEETAFRGYMQVPIERRHGPAMGVAVVSVAFAAAHSPPPWILPIFVIGATDWSILAWLLDSTVPGMIAHAVVDAIFLLWGWRDPSGFQALLARSVIETGSDSAFVALAIGTTVSVAATIVAFVWLGRKRALLRPWPSAA